MNTPLSRGLIELAATVAGFLVLGLLGQGLGAPEPAAAADPPGAYPPGMEQTEGILWLVDGYNVLCSGVLGGRERSRWWAEENRQELLARLEAFDDPGAEIWVVFDGARLPEAPEPGSGRVRTVFAPSADDWLVDEVRRRVADARAVAVVTADRKVAGRSRHRGARVVAPRELLGRCTS